MTTLAIKDETISGETFYEIVIELQSEITTLKEIISERVKKEVENYNQKAQVKFQGLVEPGDAEKRLNDRASQKKKIINVEKQKQIALEGFRKNRFFVLVDNTQVETLEHVIIVTAATQISFIKLTPLIGG